MVKNLPVNGGDMGWIPGLGRGLEEDMANHFNILPWRIHGQRSLVAYGSMGSPRVRQN